MKKAPGPEAATEGDDARRWEEALVKEQADRRWRHRAAARGDAGAGAGAKDRLRVTAEGALEGATETITAPPRRGVAAVQEMARAAVARAALRAHMERHRALARDGGRDFEGVVRAVAAAVELSNELTQKRWEAARERRPVMAARMAARDRRSELAAARKARNTTDSRKAKLAVRGVADAGAALHRASEAVRAARGAAVTTFVDSTDISGRLAALLRDEVPTPEESAVAQQEQPQQDGGAHVDCRYHGGADPISWAH